MTQSIIAPRKLTEIKCRPTGDQTLLRLRYNESAIKRRRVFIMTELVFILDRSGSMAGLEADTMVPSRFMCKFICRLRLNEVSRQ